MLTRPRREPDPARRLKPPWRERSTDLQLSGRHTLLILLACTLIRGAAQGGEIEWIWRAADGESPAFSHGFADAGLADGAWRARYDDPNSDNQVVFEGLELDADLAQFVVLDVEPHGQDEVAVLWRPVHQATFSMFRMANYEGLSAAGGGVLFAAEMRGVAGWRGTLEALRLSFPAAANGEPIVLRGVGFGEAPPAGARVGAALPAGDWLTERLRIDVADLGGPQRIEPRPPGDGWTVAVWYFGGWEPEYADGGWESMAYNYPERLPLLYDSSDRRSRHFGIQYYRNGRPEVLDWHVKWLAEHGVNLILFDWFPTVGPDGGIRHDYYANRCLETGFLGKAEAGGPATETNRFADKIQFAVMWTNHYDAAGLPRGLMDYAARHFFSQPNYFRIDGRPLFIVHSSHELWRAVGEDNRAYMEELKRMRSAARSAGQPDPWLACTELHNASIARHLLNLGYDGCLHYATGIIERDADRVPDRTDRTGFVWEEVSMDQVAQSLPTHRRIWDELAEEVGGRYLLSAVPMMDMSRTGRPVRYITRNASPEGMKRILRAARETRRRHGLRKFVALYAFNEWFEGGYFEPGTEYGYSWLRAIKEAFRDSGE